jgi:hypothetical protein
MPKTSKSVQYSCRQEAARRNRTKISAFPDFVFFVLFVVKSSQHASALILGLPLAASVAM